MCATVVATIVPSMSIKLSAAPADNSFFKQGLQSLVDVLRRVFLPHLAGGIGVFVLVSYVTYATILKPLPFPSWLITVLAWTFFVLYGGAAFIYALVAASVFALRSACIAWEDFLDGLITRVKDNLASRLDNWNDGIAKEQAKVLVRGSVREVLWVDGRRQLQSVPRWLTTVFLGALVLALRSVLVARIVKVSGQTIRLGKLFAGRATLVGAVFLNLRLFSTLLLWLVYAIGLVVLVFNFLVVFYW